MFILTDRFITSGSLFRIIAAETDEDEFSEQEGDCHLLIWGVAVVH